MKLIKSPFAWLTLTGNINPPVSTFTTRQRDPDTLMEENKGMEILVNICKSELFRKENISKNQNQTFREF